jgi:hypothetical protein
LLHLTPTSAVGRSDEFLCKNEAKRNGRKKTALWTIRWMFLLCVLAVAYSMNGPTNTLKLKKRYSIDDISIAMN